MPKYAWHDPGLSPSPVKGWFDTDAVQYASLPPEEELLMLTNPQWELRLAGAQGVQDGVLVPCDPPSALT